jgi:hypothetical protein
MRVTMRENRSAGTARVRGPSSTFPVSIGALQDSSAADNGVVAEAIPTPCWVSQAGVVLRSIPPNRGDGRSVRAISCSHP